MTDPTPSGNDLDQQITTLTEIITELATRVTQLQTRVDALTRPNGPDSGGGGGHHDPAPWVWFTPPATAENNPDPESTTDPRTTVQNFVTWYNITYVGVDGSRARPIPDCWRHHPGLAMEIATLAYSWHAANTGPSAHPREAQYWHHQWRPGFTDRLTRDWLHPDCLDNDHHPTGAPPRPDRFTPTDQKPGASPVG